MTDDFSRDAASGERWLRDLRPELDGEHGARGVARAVLHALRERLTVEESARLAGQLPLACRGLFYEGWTPRAEPLRATREAEFLGAVRRSHGGPLDARRAARAVFKVLEAHARAGETEDLRPLIPEALLGLWPQLGGGEPPAAAAPTSVKTVMTHGVLYATPERSLSVVLERMDEQRVRHLLVVNAAELEEEGAEVPADAILGILTNRDLLRRLRRDGGAAFRLDQLKVEDVFTPAPLHTTTPEASRQSAAERMAEHRISALPVLDGERLVGLVTSEDLLRGAYDLPRRSRVGAP